MSNRRRPQSNAPGGAFGDVLADLRSEEHLTQRQYDAGQLLLALLQAWHGSSAGMVGQLSCRVDAPLLLPSWPPGGGAGMHMMERMLRGMRQHERELLKFLALHRELPRGSLADWGRTRSAYRTSKTQRAVAVGRVGGMLDTIAELCLPAG